MQKKKFSEDQTKQIIREYQNSVKIKDLAKQFNCCYDVIQNLLINQKAYRKKTKDYTNLYNNIIEERKKGKSCYQIAKELKIKDNIVSKHLRENGFNVSSGHYKFRGPEKLEDYVDQIIKLYNGGQSSIKISKIIGTTHISIIKILKQNNVEIKKPNEYRKYNINEDFFEDIDTQEKAYVLGLLYADGCNCEKSGRVFISLIDLDVIEKIKRVINFDGPIYIIKPRKPQHKPAYRLSLCSLKFSQDLAKLGCVHQKTYHAKFPLNISNDLMSHFIRGLFDGDGCLTKNSKKGCWKITIAGTKDICEGLKNYIKRGNVYLARTDPKSKHETYSYDIVIRSDIKEFLNYIYQNAIIYMNRKFAKYKQFLVIA